MMMYPAAARSSTQMISSSQNPVYPPCWPLYNNNNAPAGNYSYPHGGCCNHNPTHSSYYYGHTACPYNHCPPPPPFHPHGLLYYPFPAAAAHVPPQHYYSVEQPRYDYYNYNYNNNHNCCGCNHLHHNDKRPGPNEESQPLHDNDDAKKTASPLLLKDLPVDYQQHPIMWLPQPKPNDDDDKDKYSHQDPQPSKRVGDIDGDANPSFPFRILWLPDQVGNDTKEENNLDLVAKNRLSDHKTTSEINEAEGETSGKHAAQKVIPVKQEATPNEEKKDPKSAVNSDSEDNSRGASPKTSKLPPVCLRIDPLPRKKKTSRSPSPPAEKQRSNVSNPKSLEHQAQILKKNKEEQVEGDVKTVDHANKVEHCDVPRGKGHKSEVEEKKKKKKMSEDEAALIIQSVYRGFEVRKSQPLKKLRQINEVRKQVFELRNRIQDLETTSSTIRLDGKKEVIIGETIMSLLLKLDTIQGLHPFVREVRKSVAKELVGLQDKLDSLTSVKSSETASECSPQQVMHPEDYAIQVQAQAQTDLCENHQLKATESQKNDNINNEEACNLEWQLDKRDEDDAIQDKFDQEPAESDTVICQNYQVEATESQEGCNTIDELQLESHKENFYQIPTECDEGPASGLCENNEVEAIESHKGCNIVGEPQLDQAPTECDEAPGLCEVKAAESQKGCNAIGEEPQLESHKDEAPTEGDEAQGLGLCDNHEPEAAETIGEPQLESQRDQALAEGDEAQRLCDSYQVVAAEEGCNTVGESQKDKLDEAASECDEGLGLCENHHEVEAADSGGVEAHDMNLEDDTGEVNKNQLENAEHLTYDCVVADDKHVVEPGDSLDNISLVCERDGGQLMEENEKLRAAVEELMKAGKEQLGVIRELTGRVKDLEKKLSKKTKKKKVKVNKGRRSRDVVV